MQNRPSQINAEADFLFPAVRRVEVPIANLPPALVGLRIVQISDLHIGPTIKAPFVERVVARVNELQPDLILLKSQYLR